MAVSASPPAVPPRPSLSDDSPPPLGGSPRVIDHLDAPSFQVLSDVMEVQLEPLLGFGAFGSVHYAVLLADSKTVALKAVSKEATKASLANSSAAATTSLTELLYGEAALLEELAASRHRNMLKFHGWWEDGAHVYIAQQLCVGGELPQWLSQQPAYTEQLVAKVAYDLLQALVHCHGLNVVHRDVKPQNLLFTSVAPDAYLKLADWGLGTHWQLGEPPMTEFCGTLDYASPEMIEGSYAATTDVRAGARWREVARGGARWRETARALACAPCAGARWRVRRALARPGVRSRRGLPHRSPPPPLALPAAARRHRHLTRRRASLPRP